MKSPPFGYVRAGSLADVFDLWDQSGDEARLLAGGQSLLTTLAFRLSEPSVLIDLRHVPELKGISERGDAVRVGALTRHVELGRNAAVRNHVPLLRQAVPLIAHAAIRNRGTIGGSIAYADPAAELPACAIALEAAIVAASRSGERLIPASDFFKGLYETDLGPRELIVAVEFPKVRANQRTTIVEITQRSGDYAMAGLVASADVPGERLASVRLVFFGVGSGPVEAGTAAARLESRPIEATVIAEAQEALTIDLDPPADLHGGPDLKRHLCRVLLKRAIADILSDRESAAA